MSGRIEEALTVVVDGVTVTTAGTSANVAIPAAANGTHPKYVRVSCAGQAFIKFGTNNTVAATQNSVFLNGQANYDVFDVWSLGSSGYVGYVNYQGTSGTPTTINIVPCEA